MADGTKITLLPAAPANGWQTSGKLVGPATQRRDRNPISRSQKQPDSAVLEQATADVRMALEEAAMAATHAAQRALTSVTVLEEALVILEQAAGSVAPGPPALPRYGAVAFLSPREREVLALVAEGRTNKAIATALYVSPNTVKTHVASLLHKLQADSRVQLAAISTAFDRLRG